MMLLLFAILISVVSGCIEKDGEARCIREWNGVELQSGTLIVNEWNGRCFFPAGKTLYLFGTVAGCDKCPFFDHTVFVNGHPCSDAVKQTTGTVGTTEEKRTKTTVSTTVATTSTSGYTTVSTTIQRFDPTVTALLLKETTSKWSYPLIGTLGVMNLLLASLIVYLCLRRRRPYVCCKPRTSPVPSAESLQIYPTLPTLEL